MEDLPGCQSTAAEWRSVWTPTPSTPGGLGSDLEHPQKVARIDRTAQLGREHQATALPLIARPQPLGLLLGAVLAQLLEATLDQRERDRLPGCLGVLVYVDREFVLVVRGGHALKCAARALTSESRARETGCY